MCSGGGHEDIALKKPFKNYREVDLSVATSINFLGVNRSFSFSLCEMGNDGFIFL